MKGRFPITHLSGKRDEERFIRSEYPEYVSSGLDVAPWLWAHDPQLTITTGPSQLPEVRKVEGGRYGYIPEGRAIPEPIEGVQYG